MSDPLWPHGWLPLGSSVHEISQARILKWVAITFSMGTSWPRDRTGISCIGRQIFYHWVTGEALMPRAVFELTEGSKCYEDLRRKISDHKSLPGPGYIRERSERKMGCRHAGKGETIQGRKRPWIDARDRQARGGSVPGNRLSEFGWNSGYLRK